MFVVRGILVILFCDFIFCEKMFEFVSTAECPSAGVRQGH